jgi:hypothetical protein
LVYNAIILDNGSASPVSQKVHELDFMIKQETSNCSASRGFHQSGDNEKRGWGGE